MRSRDLSWSRWAALLAACGSLAACNAIFGITDGQPTGSTTGGKGGSGGAGSTASASASATTGSGGAGSTVSSSATTGSGGATGSSGATTSSSTGGPTGPFCDGTDPANADATGPALGYGERNGGTLDEHGLGMALKSDGTMIMMGTYGDPDTKIGGATLPFPAKDGGAPWHQVYVARYSAAPATTLAWVQTFTGPGDQAPAAITVDGGRNVVVVGAMHGSLTLGEGAAQVTLTADTSQSASASDAFVARLDENGKLLWAKRFGTPQDDMALAVGTDWDGSVLVAGVVASGAATGPIPFDFGCGGAPDATWAPDLSGGPRSTIFVARYDPMGACTWHRIYDVKTGFVDPYDRGAPVALAFANGDVFLAGGSRGDTDTLGGSTFSHAGGTDVFVGRLHGDSGDHVWSRAYGDANEQYATAIQVDPCGNVVLAGNFTGSATFDATVLQDPAAPAESHAFVVELVPNKPPGDQLPPGAPRWTRMFSDHGAQDVRALSVNASSEIAVGGILTDGVGSVGVSFGGTAGVLAGPAGAAPGTTDGFVVKLDALGMTRWARRTTGTGNEAVRGVSIDDSGHTGVTGDFDGTCNFGFGNLVANGQDMYFLEYVPQ